MHSVERYILHKALQVPRAGVQRAGECVVYSTSTGRLNYPERRNNTQTLKSCSTVEARAVGCMAQLARSATHSRERIHQKRGISPVPVSEDLGHLGVGDERATQPRLSAEPFAVAAPARFASAGTVREDRAAPKLRGAAPAVLADGTRDHTLTGLARAVGE